MRMLFKRKRENLCCVRELEGQIVFLFFGFIILPATKRQSDADRK